MYMADTQYMQYFDICVSDAVVRDGFEFLCT
jgi:hypothetical protein